MLLFYKDTIRNALSYVPKENIYMSYNVAQNQPNEMVGKKYKHFRFHAQVRS